MRVDISETEQGQPNRLNVDLRDAFPDDAEGYAEALQNLQATGLHVEGGGAWAASYLRVAAPRDLPAAVVIFLQSYDAFEAACERLEPSPDDSAMTAAIEGMRAAPPVAGALGGAVAAYIEIWDTLETDGPFDAGPYIAAIRAALI